MLIMSLVESAIFGYPPIFGQNYDTMTYRPFQRSYFWWSTFLVFGSTFWRYDWASCYAQSRIIIKKGQSEKFMFLGGRSFWSLTCYLLSTLVSKSLFRSSQPSHHLKLGNQEAVGHPALVFVQHIYKTIVDKQHRNICGEQYEAAQH